MRVILVVLLVAMLSGCSTAPLALDATATAIMTGMGIGVVAPKVMNALTPAPAAAPTATTPAYLPCADVVRGPCLK